MTPEQFQLYADIENCHWWFRARRQILAAVIRSLEPPGHRSLLIDVGCGTGGNLTAFSPDYRCLGIDESAQAIQLARQRYPDIEFIHGQFPAAISSALPSASILLCSDVVEHIEHDACFVHELIAALRPGAHLVLTVPADMSLWSQHDVTNDHFRRYDRVGFERLWRDLPVKTRLITHFNSRLYLLTKIGRAYCNWRGSAFGEAGTDFQLPPSPVNRTLQYIFAGERAKITAALDQVLTVPYDRGVSLLAVLQRVAA